MRDDQYKLIVDAARARGATFPTQASWLEFKAAIDAAVAPTHVERRPFVIEDDLPPTPPSQPVSHLSLTKRVAMEIISHEAIICEAYKDSVGVWTWGIGVTDRSGHGVMRYKDNPQPVARVLEVFLWLLREKYIPDVVRAFSGFILTEAQFAAAVSFHYNTGAILRASWVNKVKAGDMAGAARAIMEWKKPPEIVGRRLKERNLFFKGQWSSDGKATIYDVRKPSYSPNWKTARRVDISADLALLMGA